MSRGQEPYHGKGDLWQPNIVARGLADVSVPSGPAHDAGEYDVNGFNRGGRQTFNRLEFFYSVLDHGWPYRGQAEFPEDGNNVIPKMKFVSVNGRSLMESRFHPNRRVVAKRCPPNSFWVQIIREQRDGYRTTLTNPAVLQAVGLIDGLTILDAGCGEGYLSRMLAERGAKVTGIDSSAELIKAARSHELANQLPVSFDVGDVTSLQYGPEEFDLVLCNHVLNGVHSQG